ncbi:MAG: tRNA (5-methylaminomethyl-2-thiouridine)(34)-methyltransferase MnmD [Sulfitobacter litoralis]|jgi:tRNA U34 5-methylaminomethyl-2-thiouridine-forming methyltransferase MnmC|uniref:tRNA (5-methylaminomethyl-2-thiouridine)(34)-methyltransferase MnmD n=1 Tax=Sulfitobacter TaxID=60136 RepID=UPI001B43FE72|nr:MULTISPECIES: tRNA (5-methylaminomethyl-2-thiouridine)(34)-methyltransferase MnmD [Sulfitobacter]MBQ0765236.1 tRNA (5-methylaminomethyl-2-thiouridine)(34)-methyltransferase MnmD [Sulfitobacter litoralis]MCF7727188.1 tRNA (5-methylaminomethyl-2-thiouridine)(34)-methyltransferase MnmD [Sulfitobacter sp. M22]MCF7778551.1 tRNA (5-methylaminomethyl-2-thiouridine)(34)-methyltransferase MnmD [Sulfitobacter sp. M220]|tara:strand:- start:388 stop:1059 length:672 start_codon:yes stop_codon:yes gene_type:complete
MENQTAEIEWKDSGVPVSSKFDDPYFSLDNGVEETQHVFIEGNDLANRFRDGFRIAELGFGTGLNFLVAWDAWERNGAKGTLHFTSFEAFPMSSEDMAQAHQSFPDFDGKRDGLLAAWSPEGGEMRFGDVVLTVVIGDARRAVPAWDGLADAWFLDGFSPAKNPELWEPDLLHDVARHTAPFGTAATYTAAGAVRRALESAGFAVERTTGYGRKRHMTRAVRV